MNNPTTGGPGSAPGPSVTPAGQTAVKKEPKARTPKPKKEGAVARPRLPKYSDEHLITVLKENAKARGAADRFKRYQTGMTVKAYVEKIKADFGRTEGQTYADMRWDEDHKFIHIGPTVVPVSVAQPAAGAPTQATA
jgi:hypothetical protein